MLRTTFSPRKHFGQPVVLAGLCTLLLLGGDVFGQSRSPARRGSSNRTLQGSAARPMAAGGGVAMEGYCPVCIVGMKKWVKGSPAFQAKYDGKTYYFPGDKQRAMFLADPAKYVPALGGDCTVCLAKMGKRVPGSIRHAAMSNQRLFLFPSAAQQQEFLANSAKYLDTDLAFGGKCAVCLVEMKKDVPGKPEFSAYYRGMRYLFPSEKQRGMFLANPAKYAAPPTQGKQTSAKTQAADQFVTVQGKSGCAGCDYGVAPIGAPDELGLAINTPDGRIFVIENAHIMYPKLYEQRFEGGELEVSGKVLKRDGKFTWIEPSEIKTLN